MYLKGGVNLLDAIISGSILSTLILLMVLAFEPLRGAAAYAIVSPSKFIKGIFDFIEKILDRIENKKVR